MFRFVALTMAKVGLEQFPEQYCDAGTGSHYNYFRDYDPRVGRYIESDPIGLLDSSTRYAYVAQAQLTESDSLGLAKRSYSISRHVLECVSNAPTEGPPVGIGPGGLFSGKDQCRDNPSKDCQSDKDNGPVPEGDYRINSHESVEFFRRLESIPRSKNVSSSCAVPSAACRGIVLLGWRFWMVGKSRTTRIQVERGIQSPRCARSWGAEFSARVRGSNGDRSLRQCPMVLSW